MSNQNFQYAPPPDPQRQRYGVPPAQNQQYLQAMQQQAEAGLRYCRDCGAPVQPGSTVCLNCNYIINPEAFRQAQRLVRSRNTPPPPPPSARQAARSGQRRSTRRTPQPRSVSGGDVGEIIGSAVVNILQHYDILPPSASARRTPPVDPASIPQTIPRPAVEPVMPELDLSAGKPAAEPQPEPPVREMLQQPAPEPQPQPQTRVLRRNPTATGPKFHFDVSGDVFCPSCGTEVAPGACQCIHCGYVIDAAQYQLAQRQVEDRNAKLERKDLIKSFFIPGYGKRMYKKYHLRRPQIAEPCRKAERIRKAIVWGIIIGLILGFIIF